MGNLPTSCSAKYPAAEQHTPRSLMNGGFTLIELMLGLGIVGILSTLAVPSYLGFIQKARMANTVAEMNTITMEIKSYAITTGQYPDSLADIGWTRMDNWGNPYQYLPLDCSNPVLVGQLGFDELIVPVRMSPHHRDPHLVLTVRTSDPESLIHLVKQGGNGGSICGSGKPRMDHFLHPLNSDFDLYSMGEDGQSVAPLTAKQSRDDIIRANDGGFYGLASSF